MLNKLFFNNLYIGIEYTFYEEDAVFNRLVIKKKNCSFLIENTEQCKKEEELFVRLPKNSPIFLVINNQHILTKKTASNQNGENALYQAFPNLKIEEFYYETLSTEGNTFISICRKQYIEELVDFYHKKGHTIAGVSLGNLIISDLIAYTQEPILKTSNAIVTIDGSAITDIQSSFEVFDTTYELNGIQISNNYLLAFAGIIKYYAKGESKTQNNLGALNLNLRQNFKDEYLFSTLKKLGIGFVFILVLTNALFYYYYFTKIDKLKDELLYDEKYRIEFTGLKEALEKKERQIADINSATTKISFYFDSIAYSLPESILLTTMVYQPLLKNSKADEPIRFETDLLKITGSSLNAQEFTKWLETLERFEWINEVTLQNYGVDTDNLTVFELHILIKE